MNFTNEHRARALADAGFHVFPLEENGKLPLIKDYPNRATRDHAQIEKWWGQNPDRNIGISTTRYGDDKSLLVVDVDDKKGKKGSQRLLELELEGFDFPPTMEQETPSGGKHLIYIIDHPLRQGVDVLGEGLDTRSKGGYIVGPGSRIDGVRYRLTRDWVNLAPAPLWLVDRLGRAREVAPLATTVLEGVDPERAARRAVAWLQALPVAQEGARNHECFKAAAQLKDFGCNEVQAYELMLDFWKAEPFPPDEHIADIVRNAFRYGHEPQGALAPEAVFSVVTATEALSPLEEMNKTYCYIKDTGSVIKLRRGFKGGIETVFQTLDKFHGEHMKTPLMIGDKVRWISKWWLEWEGRREFEGVVFAPGQEVGSDWFNLWRGFSVDPADTWKHPSVEAFLEHAFENVARNNQREFDYIMGWFAHMIQHPGQKVLTSPVCKGLKGTGKNVLFERVGALIKAHFLVTSSDRYLLGQFNSHFENLLLFVLDEAAWAGDKKAEGRLKDLITGSEHIIERKGLEAYKIDNLVRVGIIGNEDWLVPATADERRFAVFDVGAKRQNDIPFFDGMRIGMEQGGYSNLLRYLLDFDLSKVDVNVAPKSQALIAQKHQSLTPIQEWWLDCLENNELVGSDYHGPFPPRAPTNRIEEAFRRWTRNKNIRSRLCSKNALFAEIRKLAPSFQKIKAAPDAPDDTTWAYANPGIKILRRDWDRFIGGTHIWSDDNA